MKIVGTSIVVALMALLAASIYYLYSSWTTPSSGDAMPGWMVAAMVGGVLFSLLFGCGLMALMFYSSRHGYDDRAARGNADD